MTFLYIYSRPLTSQLLKQIDMGAYDFVQSFQSEFDRLASYACLDASRFSNCINPRNKIMILDRYNRARDRKAKDAGMSAGMQFGIGWNAKALRGVYDRVVAERAGVCTSFAKAAAHIMTRNNTVNIPKIEIVGYTNHVFLIVGRQKGNVAVTGQGFFSKHKLQDYIHWGSGWVIVDVWAGAMGWPMSIYDGSKGYPFTEMLSPLTLIMTTDD